jgi:hypothetical protein
MREYRVSSIYRRRGWEGICWRPGDGATRRAARMLRARPMLAGAGRQALGGWPAPRVVFAGRAARLIAAAAPLHSNAHWFSRRTSSSCKGRQPGGGGQRGVRR